MNRPPRRGLLMEPIIADFDGIRRKQFRRWPVTRACSRCKREFVIARVFSDPRGRFIMRTDWDYQCMHPKGRYEERPHHLVRDRFAKQVCHEVLRRYRMTISEASRHLRWKLREVTPIRDLWLEIAQRRAFFAEDGADLHLTDEALAQMDESAHAEEA